MEAILSYFESVNIDIILVLKVVGILLGAFLVLSLAGRFIFGRDSALSAAVSSAVGILFIYMITVLLQNAATGLRSLLSPLPYLSISGNSIVLFSFEGAHYTTLCSQVLSMIILSFLVNLADRWMPQGKNFFSWIFFRCMTIILAMVLHLLVYGVLGTVLPGPLQTYAPTVLLGLLVLSLATGCLKFIISIFIATVNPLIAAFYAFFFSNIVGKQITKAVLTTAILSGMILLLQYLGIYSIDLSSGSLIVTIPVILLLSGLWYIVGSLMKK